MSDSAFDELLRSQSTAAQREMLHEARRAHALDENDALWGLLQVVQEYCASLPARPAPAPLSASYPSWVFQPWQWACAGVALQTLALSLAFFVGHNWSSALPPDVSWLRALLSVPAGWMMFLLTLPLLGQGALSSWRARRHDGIVGWLLVSLFSLTIGAAAGALVWLVL